MKPTSMLPSKSVFFRILVILSGLASLAVAKVEVRQQEGGLAYRLKQDALLSEKGKKELTSGISTQIVVLAKLVEVPDRLVTQQIVSMDAKYNMWEENFRLQFSDGHKQIFKKQSDLETTIQNPGPFVLLQINELKNNASYKIEVIQTVNPMGADRLDAVKKWVTGQKVSAQAASSPKDQASRESAAESAFSGLFFSLWKRASAGEVLVGEVRLQLQSPTFTKASLQSSKEGTWQ